MSIRSVPKHVDRLKHLSEKIIPLLSPCIAYVCIQQKENVNVEAE